MESSSDMCHINCVHLALSPLFVRAWRKTHLLLSLGSLKISLSFLASQHLHTGGLGLS